MEFNKHIDKIAISVLAAVNLRWGLEGILNQSNRLEGIRNAIYSHADKITPEVIQSADKAVSEATMANLTYTMLPTAYFALAGFCLYGLFAKIKEDKQ
jgi:hypothetical protein